MDGIINIPFFNFNYVCSCFSFIIVDAVFVELKLLRDQLEQLTSKADAEAKCKIAMAREQVSNNMLYPLTPFSSPHIDDVRAVMIACVAKKVCAEHLQ